jgi:hypothetical protein
LCCSVDTAINDVFVGMLRRAQEVISG